MIVEFFTLFEPYTRYWGIGAMIILFVAGFFAGTKIKLAFGLLILVGAFVIDFVISNWIVVSNNLEYDRFTMPFEAIAYGIIALGWIISAVIGAASRK